MQLRLNIPEAGRKYLFAFIMLLIIGVITVSFNMGENDAYDLSRREISLRRIGHELLLQSKDSTSRVMPVRKIGENEYQVRFEKELSFEPDSLASIIRRSFANVTSDYIVNVMDSRTSEVTYGFAIAGNKKDDIIACLGREQPTARYLVNIKFPPAKNNSAKNSVLMGSIALLGFLGFVFLKPRRKNVVEEDTASQAEVFETAHSKSDLRENHVENCKVFQLSSITFDSENRKLISKDKTVALTLTETRVLHLLASSPNETIERTRLQKEIWEDEGVIVGRSLDMFISKLRKKLEIEPNVEIVGLRGKGYRLKVGTMENEKDRERGRENI